MTTDKDIEDLVIDMRVMLARVDVMNGRIKHLEYRLDCLTRDNHIDNEALKKWKMGRINARGIQWMK